MKNDENGQLSCGIYSSPAAARSPLQGWVGDCCRDRSILIQTVNILYIHYSNILHIHYLNILYIHYSNILYIYFTSSLFEYYIYSLYKFLYLFFILKFTFIPYALQDSILILFIHLFNFILKHNFMHSCYVFTILHAQLLCIHNTSCIVVMDSE